jgi:hypothetical protein
MSFNSRQRKERLIKEQWRKRIKIALVSGIMCLVAASLMYLGITLSSKQYKGNPCKNGCSVCGGDTENCHCHGGCDTDGCECHVTH